MTPIQITPYITNGIVIFFPSTDNYPDNYIIQIQIFYSQTNPLEALINCTPSQSPIWTSSDQITSTGAVFLYQTNQDLAIGFYTILATMITDTQPKQGQITVGLYQPTPYLVIGLPYSIYPPISLS